MEIYSVKLSILGLTFSGTTKLFSKVAALFTFLSDWYEGSNSSTSLSTLVIVFFSIAILVDVRWCLIVILVWIWTGFLKHNFEIGFVGVRSVYWVFLQIELNITMELHNVPWEHGSMRDNGLIGDSDVVSNFSNQKEHSLCLIQVALYSKTHKTLSLAYRNQHYWGLTDTENQSKETEVSGSAAEQGLLFLGPEVPQ